MKKLLKSFKTEINPTPEQKNRINRTIGTCRYVYNFYLAHNKELHDKGERFVSGKSFSVWLNNDYIPNNPDKAWIKDVYSKAVKKVYRGWLYRIYKIFQTSEWFSKVQKERQIRCEDVFR